MQCYSEERKSLDYYSAEPVRQSVLKCLRLSRDINKRKRKDGLLKP